MAIFCLYSLVAIYCIYMVIVIVGSCCIYTAWLKRMINSRKYKIIPFFTAKVEWEVIVFIWVNTKKFRMPLSTTQGPHRNQ